ncbi:MAG: DUF2935 domain-containing protein [Bacillota bacterium]
MQTTTAEMAFWLGIMRDHAIFIRDNLGPYERQWVESAEKMRIVFEELLTRVQSVTREEAVSATENLIALKSQLLMLLLKCSVVIHLQPSDLSHMINEAQEFLRVLGRLPAPPADTPALLLHLNRLWLSDAAGHSAMLYRILDPHEYRLLMELQQYEYTFNSLFIKAYGKTEMYGAVRTDFPSLYGMVNEARGVVQTHIDLLSSLERQIGSCTVQNNGTPLLPNHMIREETYFLNRVAQLLGRDV